MKLYDLFNYVFCIMKEEVRQIIRIVTFLLISATLVFGLNVLSDTLRNQMTLHFHHRYTLIPMVRSSQEMLPPLPYPLLPNTINNLDFHQNDGLIQFEVNNLNLRSTELLTLEFDDSYTLSLRHDLFESLNWNENDVVCLGSSCFPIEKYHTSGVDVRFPRGTIQTELLPLSYDNIITLYSENIAEDLKTMNLALMRTDVVYTVETLRIDQLILSLITGIQIGLTVILAIIFLVTCTNINTVFPLFIVNFKEELMLLRYFGMPLKQVSRIFKLLALVMIGGSVLGSWIIVWSFSTMLTFVFDVSISYPIASLMLTASCLLVLSLLSVFRYITKTLQEFIL